MRKTLLAAASLLLLGVTACKKEYYTTNSTVTTPATQNVNIIPNTPNYVVSGVQDVTLQKVDSGTAPNVEILPISISYGNKSQERLRVSLEGAPAKLYDSISVKSGYPSFSSTLLFADSGVAAGTYPVKLVVTGDSSGRREYGFDVHVLPVPPIPPVPACYAALIDTPYLASSSCAGSSSYPVGIRAASGTNTVRFNNFDNAGGSLIGTVDCATQTITIPSQTVNGISILGGSGFYSIGVGGKQVSLSVQVSIGGGGSINCTLTMSK